MFFLFLRIWPILGISYKRDPTLCGLLGQLCFTQPYVFRAHPCCSVSQAHIPFYGRVIFYRVDVRCVGPWACFR